VLSWDEAKQFCERRNSTLPIISDEQNDKLLQQFIVSDACACGLLQNIPVWTSAHVEPFNGSDTWHWIDKRPSGTVIRAQTNTVNFTSFKSIIHQVYRCGTTYLRSILHTHHSTRSLRLSNTNLLCAPFVRTLFGSRSFSVAAPKIWNSLPPALRMCTSHDTFRHQLKTQYLALQPT